LRPKNDGNNNARLTRGSGWRTSRVGLETTNSVRSFLAVHSGAASQRQAVFPDSGASCSRFAPASARSPPPPKPAARTVLPLVLPPHDCRRVFAAEHLNNNTPVHIIQALRALRPVRELLFARHWCRICGSLHCSLLTPGDHPTAGSIHKEPNIVIGLPASVRRVIRDHQHSVLEI
jgi:hypothetical protein